MSDFRSTRLWRTTLAARDNDPHAPERERLRQAFEQFRERAAMLAAEIPQDLRDLTVHDVTHLDALWETADMIVGEHYDITPIEAFILGGAFLVHDLGLGLAAYPGGLSELKERTEWSDLMIGILKRILGRAPKPEEIEHPPDEAVREVKFQLLRNLHAERAEKLVLTQWRETKTGTAYHLIEQPELRNAIGPVIGKIAHSHWWPSDDLVLKFAKPMGAPVHYPNDWSGDPLRLALILRLADAAQIDARRAPPFLRVFALLQTQPPFTRGSKKDSTNPHVKETAWCIRVNPFRLAKLKHGGSASTPYVRSMMNYARPTI
ncbi:MAG: hypothetical protein L0338_20730 [Acidobacteria bacterium]|nr:hypothetical protein [Acidobacteriota bacterium]